MKQFERADGAWLTAALLLPAATVCAPVAPAAVAAGALAALILLYCITRLADAVPATFQMPGWFLVLRAGWSALVLGRLLDLTRGLFPQAAGSWLIPAVLVLLSALACAKGASVPARVGAVLWPFLLALLAVVALFAAPDVQLSRLRAASDGGEMAAVLALVLLPGMYPMRRGRARLPGFLLLALVLVTVPSMLCFGMLGRAQTQALPFPLYAAAQSISVFGIMERFEVLLSGALAFSGFCALSFVLKCGCDDFPVASNAAVHLKFLALSAAGFALMFAVSGLPGWVWLAGSGLFCGLLPIAILALGGSKKVEENMSKPVDKTDRI